MEIAGIILIAIVVIVMPNIEQQNADNRQKKEIVSVKSTNELTASRW